MSYLILRLILRSYLIISIVSSFKIKQEQITVVYSPEDDEPSSLESPQWSVQENALYWVSNAGEQKIFRLDGDTGEISSRHICYGSPSLIVPVRDHPGFVVVSVRTSLYLLRWGAKGGDSALRLLTTVDLGKPNNRIDDGKADAMGRLFFGTYAKFDFKRDTSVIPDLSTLYSIDASNFAHPAIQKRPVSLSNGIAWSLDNKKMYYNDSPTRNVVALDYDLEKGMIANETVVYSSDYYDQPGIVDGMTIDRDGNLWVASFAPRMFKIDPTSRTLLDVFELPVDRVTSVMWGGPGLEVMFVTTASVRVEDPMPLSGSLLAISGLGTGGVPENQFVFPDVPNY